MIVSKHPACFSVDPNPGNRGLCIGGELLFQQLKSAHQVSHDLLLLQLANREQDKNGEILHEDYWTLITVKGQLKELPADLKAILRAEPYWGKVQSCQSRSGRLKLVLSTVTRFDRTCERILRAVSLELTESAEVASFQTLVDPSSLDEQLRGLKQSSPF